MGSPPTYYCKILELRGFASPTFGHKFNNLEELLKISNYDKNPFGCKCKDFSTKITFIFR
jgi:hypothetical protein